MFHWYWCYRFHSRFGLQNRVDGSYMLSNCCLFWYRFLNHLKTPWNYIHCLVQFGSISNTSQSFNFGGRISFMKFIETAQMDIATSNRMWITFSTSFVFLLFLLKNPWKIHVKIIIICHLRNILLVWVSHPVIECIQNSLPCHLYRDTLHRLFWYLLWYVSGTCRFYTICLISTTAIFGIYTNESKPST